MNEVHQIVDGIDALLKTHAGLRLAPSSDNSIRIKGRLRFVATTRGFEAIEDNYEIEMSIPPNFPKEIPLVWETGGRIPLGWHRNQGKTLCLGSPLTTTLIALEAKTISLFVEKVVVPYLFQRSYFERYGKMPFGELDHGLKGVLKDFADQFGVDGDLAAISMVFLCSLRKRVANKQSCPCGTGKRLGCCRHHWKVNELRKILRRPWFKNQLQQIDKWRKVEDVASPNQVAIPK